MLDVFAILSSTLCVLYVIVRAVAFDYSLPWFEGAESSPRDNEKTGDAGPTGRGFRKF